MRIYIFRFLLIFICAILQVTLISTVLNIFDLKEVKLDLILIITVYFAFKDGIMSGQVTGFTGGLFEDLLANPPQFGITTLVNTIVGFTVGTFHKRIYSENFMTIFLIVFICTIFKGLLLKCLIIFDSQITSISEYLLDYFLHSLSIELILNSILAPLIFNLLNKLNLTIKRTG